MECYTKSRRFSCNDPYRSRAIRQLAMLNMRLRVRLGLFLLYTECYICVFFIAFTVYYHDADAGDQRNHILPSDGGYWPENNFGLRYLRSKFIISL